MLRFGDRPRRLSLLFRHGAGAPLGHLPARGGAVSCAPYGGGAGGRFIQARVLKIDPVNRRVFLSDHTSLDYDVLSCNLGSEIIPVTGYEPDIIPVKPIENLYAAGRDLESRSEKGALRVAVIGGGAAGVELAGNLSRISRRAAHQFQITQVSKDEILQISPENAPPGACFIGPERHFRDGTRGSQANRRPDHDF